MFIEIVTPDEKVFEGEVESAILPGIDGSFQVLNNHAPLVSTLGKGALTIRRIVEKRPEEIEMKIEGGAIEVLNNKVVVLAEKIEKEVDN